MRKFFNKMRYRIARAIAPNGVTVTSDCDLDVCVTELVVDSNISGFKEGVRMGISVILDYMKHLNGLQAEEWCKKAYEYTEWKMNNLSFKVEKKHTDDGIDVRISVPKDYEEDNSSKDLAGQE